MRIGEVAERTGLSVSNIRFYEKKGLIEPARGQENQYRDYSEKDVECLKRIILYRKMDLSIETIYSLEKENVSVENTITEQIEVLTLKKEMLQGSIDLCQKILQDEGLDKRDVDFYLHYVKEEEASGTRFAEVDELLTDFASFTLLDKFYGDPFVGFIFRKSWMRRAVKVTWLLIWIAFPVIAMTDAWIRDGRVRPASILFWIVWVVFLGISFWKFRRKIKYHIVGA